MGPRVRQADVAARAGVSVPVVSRALSGHADVAESTRRRVLQAARELGYVRGAEPRGRPPTFRSTVIELAMATFEDSWSAEVVAGVRSEAHEHGLDLVLTSERDAPGDDWAERARHRRSLGVVAGLVVPTRAQGALLREAGIPLVLLDPRADPPAGSSSVSADNHRGGVQAAAHLLELGHRDFLLVTGAPPFRYGRARARGFQETVEAVPGTRVRRVPVGWNARDAHLTLLPVLRDSALSASAAFCVADVLAAGLLRAAADTGIRVPDDLSVVGFDDAVAAGRLSPPLTTVRQPVREMAAAATRMLVEMIDAGTLAASSQEVPTRLVARRSTASPPVAPRA